MVTAVVAAGAVLAACGLTLFAVRRANERADRRLRRALDYVDRQLEVMSSAVAQAVDAAVEPGVRLPPSTLSLDFDEVLETLIAEAAALTRADAVVLRIEGPRGRPVVAFLGSDVELEDLDRWLGPPSGRTFQAARIDWTYPVGEEADTASFGSALVTPLTGDIGGTLAVYARAQRAFSPQDASTVRRLVEDMSVALANARRFADVEARINVDPASGVPNRRGYELELAREAVRSRRTGRPLSVVVLVDRGHDRAEAAETARLAELARLVDRAVRADDVACLRGKHELAILLPATNEAGASALSKRLEAHVERALGPEAPTLAMGLFEALPDETAEALDFRIESSLNRPRTAATISVLEDSRTASTATSSTVHTAFPGRAGAVQRGSDDVLRGDVLEAVAGELIETHQFGRSLALVVLEVAGFREVSEREGREAADSRLSRIAGRLHRSLGTGSVHRLGAEEFVLVLPGSGVDEAEALVDALQSSLQPPYDEAGVALSAGVTEIADGDDAQTALGRAEHALWQARQAGRGTVVVAFPSKRPTPPR